MMTGGVVRKKGGAQQELVTNHLSIAGKSLQRIRDGSEVSCPSVVARSQSSRIRLSYLDDAPFPLLPLKPVKRYSKAGRVHGPRIKFK